MSPQRTPLYALHDRHGARFVDFAGWSMPLQFPSGIIAEHQHCRTKASLFDVSHMVQLTLKGSDADRALETIVVGDVRGLDIGKTRYTLMTNAEGGVVDDLMVTRTETGLFLVLNAARRDRDLDHLRNYLGDRITIDPLDDRALLALQGPRASEILGRLEPAVDRLAFMESCAVRLADANCRVSRLGYTGEDGFEISVPGEFAINVAETILNHDDVEPAGLGARDTLRLEAGLCLYGNDLDETITPVEAGLKWTVAKRRRETLDFLGGDVIGRQLENGSERHLVGLVCHDRMPARRGSDVVDDASTKIGVVTSGCFSPTLSKPIALALIEGKLTKSGTKLGLIVRGRRLACEVTKLPFVPHRYKRT